MICAININTVRGLVIAAALASSLVPACCQGLTHTNRDSGPPEIKRPKIDEQAYKAALERIPPPDKPYDPWGIAKPADGPKTTKKSN